MDNRKGKAGSTSSITSQLFGSQDSSSFNDVFASIFPPKGVGRNSGCSEGKGSWQKEPSGAGNLNTKQDNSYKHGDGNKEKNSIYQQEGGEPCYLSSSIYYGGREMYSRAPAHSTSNSYSNFKKDGEEDDPNGAARGNWWQGSLYY